jgi:helicase
MKTTTATDAVTGGRAMRIETLEAYNVSPDLVEIWRDSVGGTLLPVQEMAVKEYGLFTGGNLIVFSPTSSGKTFIGEMAAVKAARENTKVFYLVPQKALADEKHRELSARYAPAGIDVVVSSRDRREFDAQIVHRQFQIAIVVYEKLQALLVSQPNLIQGIGLVVVDELQTLTDDERGPSLELLLTKLKMAASRPRMIGLSAVLGKASLLADWLEAKLLIDTRRPVELRKGVLCQGTFRYREHNSEREGTEEILVPPTKDRGELLIGAADALTRRGEQALVFVPDRATAVSLARRLAERARLATAESTRTRLRDGEETLARAELLATLESGIAFHHADLTLDERRLVEDGFRAGEIRAVVSTTTLAVGMNLPAKNVLLDGRRWKLLHQYGRWSLEDLTKSEYENMSGRAGRLSLTKDFGRSVLVTSSPFEADAWLRFYIGREFEAVAPTLKNAPIEDHVLDVIASGMGRSRDQIAELLLASFTGRVHWKDAMGREQFLGTIDQAIALCRDGGLVREVAERQIALTHLGRACAARGIGVRTGARMARWAADSKDAPPSTLEILTLAGATVAGDAVYVSLNRKEDRRKNYRADILTKARAGGVDARPIFRQFAEDRWAAEFEESKAHKKTAILLDWIDELPTKEIEERYDVWAGAVNRIGEEYAWLIQALADICRATNWPDPDCDAIATLAERLVFGVREDALPLMRFRVPRLGRAVLARLRRAGIADPEEIGRAKPEDVRRAVGRQDVFDALLSRLPQPTEPHDPEPQAPSERQMPLPSATVQVQSACDAVLTPSPDEPVLVVDPSKRRVSYRGIEIPTKPPNHIQRQALCALAVLASHPGETLSDADLVEGMKALGLAAKRHLAPDTRDLRYKMLRPFRARLRGTPYIDEVEQLVVSMPGGLRLDAPGHVIVQLAGRSPVSSSQQ